MTAVAERYRKLAAGFTARVESVPDDRWSSQSPCEKWTARDVVRHMVATCGFFFKLVGRTMPPGPSVDDDPRGAWTAARDAVQAGLEDPGIASLELSGDAGPQTFEQAIDRFVCADVVVHTWDLARATGQDEEIDPELAAEALEISRAVVNDELRELGAFGPAVEVGDDAPVHHQLVGFLGRTP